MAVIIPLAMPTPGTVLGAQEILIPVNPVENISWAQVTFLWGPKSRAQVIIWERRASTKRQWLLCELRATVVDGLVELCWQHLGTSSPGR
jgi:hypothetical protein